MDVVKISNELNAMVCEMHHKSAKVILVANAESADAGHWVSVKDACCKEFEDKITHRASSLFTQGISDDNMNALEW